MARKGALVDGRFELSEKLAEGALGEVWSATDRQSGEAVVVKLAGSGGERARAVFLREAKLLAEVRSAHLPELVATGQDGDGEPYSVTRHIEGVELGVWQRDAGVTAIRRVYGELARALAELHGQGFVHRDVKPSNVLVGRGEPPVRLLDLGFAVRVGETDAFTQTTSTIVGTPRYLSPEALLAHPLGPSADIYALGVMFCEALTGSEPWSTHGSFAEVLMRRLKEAPSLAGFAEVAPTDVDLLRSMLLRDPAARPTAASVATRLAATAGDEEARKMREPPSPAPLEAGPSAPAKPSLAPASPSPAPSAPPAAAPSFPAIPRPVLPEVGKGASPDPKPAASARARPLVLLAAAVGLVLLGAALSRWLPPPDDLPPSDPPVSTAPTGTSQGVPPKVFPISTPEAAHSPDGQSTLYAILGLGAGAALFYVYTRRRGVERAASSDALVLAQRIQALEVRLSGGGAVAAMGPAELSAAVQKSVMVALESRPVSDVGRALELLAKQLDQGEKKPPSWDKRITTVTGVLAAVLAVTSGVYAFGTTLLRPNTPPHFEACGTEGQRALRDRPFELRPEVKDPDGDPLTFDYAVSDGRLEPTKGPLALLDTSAVKGTLLSVDIWVSDGENERVHTACSVRVNGAPEGNLLLPPPGAAGSAVEVSVSARDPDGDPLLVAWSSSCDGLGGTTGTRAFTRLPAGTCKVIAKVSDPWQSIELVGELRSAP